MKYTDKKSARSRNITSEQAYMNEGSIYLEIPRSRVPYQCFQVDVALQVGSEVGPFVSDSEIHSK